MIKRLAGISLALILLFTSASAQKSKKAYELIYKDVQLLRQQILELDKEIGKNAEDIKFIKNQLSELLSLLRLFQKEQANFKEDQKNIPAQYRILLEKIEGLNTQLAAYNEELLEIKKASLQAARAVDETMEEQVPLPSEKETEEKKKEGQTEKKDESTEELPPPSTLLSPKEVYNMAYADYRKGNFELAIDGFKIYREQFVQSPLADNALYWIGECYFSQEKFEEAIDSFNDLILNYPQGDKIPAAYLKKGISLTKLGKKEEALSVFKLLVSKFPLEEETKIAQQKIKELISENERY
jgi:tol-pal system protein YbgF